MRGPGSFSAAAAVHVRVVVRSAARTLLQPLRLLFRSLRGGSGNRDSVSPNPQPFPLSPTPARKGPVCAPPPPVRPPARYTAAMSAQAQMRAMLDQLMGTSRDGKSLPAPWGWGRGWGRRGEGASRAHLGLCVCG